jgi:hypothetical protein
MTTTKSYSDSSRAASLYRHSVKQLLPFGVISIVAFVLGLFVPYYVTLSAMEITAPDAYYPYSVGDFIRDYTHGFYLAEEQGIFIMILVIVLALGVALSATKFMHSKKAVDVYHSLPVRRSVLFAVGMLAGLTVVLLPFLAVALATIILQAASLGAPLFTAGYWAAIFTETAAVVAMALITYTFTAFISVNVGSTFDAFAISGTLGFSPALIYLICAAIANDLIYGLSLSYNHVLKCSPFLLMFERYRIYWESDASPLPIILTCFAVAAVFYLLGMLCYNRRKSEIAEVAQFAGPFQTAVKCIAAFLGAAMFYGIFYDSGRTSQLVGMFIGAILIGIIPELIFSRGVRHIRKNILWLAGTGAVCCIMLLVVDMDLLGIESKVPNPQNVQAVSITYGGRFSSLAEKGYDNEAVTLQDDEAIAIITQMHRLAVDSRGAYNIHNYYDNDDFISIWPTLSLSYTTNTGQKISRSYSYLYKDAYLQLSALEANDDFIAQSHPIFFYDALGVAQSDIIQSVLLCDSIGGKQQNISLTPVNKARLLTALQEDMKNETLAEIQQPSAQPLGYLRIAHNAHLRARVQGGGLYAAVQAVERSNYPTHTYVVLTKEYANTLALLREAGYGDTLGFYPEQVERIYVSNYYRYAYYSQNSFSVSSILPAIVDYARDYESYYYNDYGDTKIEDPDTIAALLEKSYAQMLTDDQRVYYLLCEMDGRIVGHRMILEKDLPASLRPPRS